MRLNKHFLYACTLLASTQTFAAVLTDVREDNQIVQQQLHSLTKTAKSLSPSAYTLQPLQETQAKNTRVKHTRYQQMYQGLPIFGYHILSHTKPNAQTVYSGIMINELEKDLSTKQIKPLDADVAFQNKKKEYLRIHPSAHITTYPNSKEVVIFLDKKNVAHQAYHVTFLALDKENAIIERPHWIIDANSGEQLKAWNGLTTADSRTAEVLPKPKYVEGGAKGGNEKIGFYEYGKDIDALEFSYTHLLQGPTCQLSNEKVKIMDFKSDWGWGSATEPSTPRWQCDSKSTFYSGDSINGAASPNADAYAFGTIVMSVYQSFNISPIKSPKLVMNLHVGKNFPNAFWDGFSVNFGDGISATEGFEGFYPFVLIDIVGHEISHAFTENASGLIYDGQSGGLNESFSDMMGKYVELLLNEAYFPEKPVSWAIGEGVMKGKGALRYMDVPSKDGISIDHMRQYRDDLDVHHTSGIFNRVFYLMANDPRLGEEENELVNNMRPLIALFAYTNNNYWYPSVDFAHAAWGLLQAAEEFDSFISDRETSFSKIALDALKEVGIICEWGYCEIEDESMK